MRNASATGTAIQAGMCRQRASGQAAAPSTHQQIANATRKPRSGIFSTILGLGALIILSTSIITSAADAPPPDLMRRIAHHEDETVAERGNYAYRQSVTLQELNDHGMEVGRYSETRDIVFSPQQERSEKQVSVPVDNLKNLRLTDEDFRDLRDIQPFVLREEFLRNYEIKFRGDEQMDGQDCWVVQIRPRQILSTQRFFEGLLWASKKDYAIVRTEGRAVPQMLSLHQENLFPRFTTLRKPVAGSFWFPALTYGDDTLPFHTGPQRIKLTIRYTNYQKFGSSSVITFDAVK